MKPCSLYISSDDFFARRSRPSVQEAFSAGEPMSHEGSFPQGVTARDEVQRIFETVGDALPAPPDIRASRAVALRR